MKKKWLKISAIVGVGLFSLVGVGLASISNNIEYEVLSKQLLVLDNEGVTFRVVFGISNPSMLTVDIWNQNYDVFISGYKTLEITSTKTYRVFADANSSIPLDVRLNWADIYHTTTDIDPLINLSLANIPIVIKGRFAARYKFLQLKKIRVKMTATLGYFLP